MIKGTNLSDGLIEERHVSKALLDKLGLGKNYEKDDIVTFHEKLDEGWYDICDECNYANITARIISAEEYQEDNYIVRKRKLLKGLPGNLKVDSGIIKIYLPSMENVIIHFSILVLD